MLSGITLRLGGCPPTAVSTLTRAPVATILGRYLERLLRDRTRSQARPPGTPEERLGPRTGDARMRACTTHSTQRLHSYLGDIPPTELEQTFYSDHITTA